MTDILTLAQGAFLESPYKPFLIWIFFVPWAWLIGMKLDKDARYFHLNVTMWNSLQKLMALPDDTVVYCAHEYTQANAAFALTVEPQNDALQTRAKEIDALRAQAEAKRREEEAQRATKLLESGAGQLLEARDARNPERAESLRAGADAAFDALERIDPDIWPWRGLLRAARESGAIAVLLTPGSVTAADPVSVVPLHEW